MSCRFPVVPLVMNNRFSRNLCLKRQEGEPFLSTAKHRFDSCGIVYSIFDVLDPSGGPARRSIIRIVIRLFLVAVISFLLRIVIPSDRNHSDQLVDHPPAHGDSLYLSQVVSASSKVGPRLVLDHRKRQIQPDLNQKSRSPQIFPSGSS